jgi:breast cancer metastasis-suppressor 1-like protein
MTDLEKQFLALKDQLYVERISQVERKLEEVRAGRAQEYLQPLEELQDNMRERIEVAGILSQLKITNINSQHEAEMIASKQNFEVFLLLFH